MRSATILAMLGLLAIAGCASTQPGAIPGSADISGSVAVFYGGRHFGSGVTVGERDGKVIVATAAHVVRAGLIEAMLAGAASRPAVGFAVDGRPAEVVAVSETADVALLAFDPGPATYRINRLGAAKVGDGVMAVGWVTLNGRLRQMFQGGHVSSVGEDMIYATTGGCPGFSGSGVWNGRLEVVGIMVGCPILGGAPWETVTRVVPAAKIAELLADL